MKAETIAYAYVQVSPPLGRFFNCVLSANAAGDYNLTIGGSGGADLEVCNVIVASGAGSVGSIQSVIHTSNTVKRIQFRDDEGVIADPDSFWVEIKRYPPLPDNTPPVP